MKPIISTIIVILATNLISAAQSDWSLRLTQMSWLNRVNKIKLLKTDSLEAKRILGEPEKEDYKTADFIEYYTIKNGRVILTFTTSKCQSIDGAIKKGAVKEILYQPKLNIPFNSLKIPLKEFTKSVESDVPSLFIYKNETKGITIYKQHGKINSIVFTVPQQKQLNCSNE